jgi:hypothetical protein
VLSRLADELSSGNIEAALKRFSPSSLNREVLTSLSKEQRAQLAVEFKSAKLVRTTEQLRVYEFGSVGGAKPLDQSGKASTMYSTAMEKAGEPRGTRGGVSGESAAVAKPRTFVMTRADSEHWIIISW